MMQMLHAEQRGSQNAQKGLLCQDRTSYCQKGRYHAIALSDGSGRDNYAAMGAYHAAETAAGLLADSFELLYQMEEKKLQYNVIVNIRNSLYELCSRHGLPEISRLRSTVLAAVVDERTNRYLAVHLGDGYIGAVADGRKLLLSRPENGVNPAYTYQTSMIPVREAIHIRRGIFDQLDEICLLSDGWRRRGDQHKDVLKRYLKQGLIWKELDQGDDDVSFICLRSSGRAAKIQMENKGREVTAAVENGMIDA